MNVGMLRKVIEDLPDYANIQLNFNTASDELARVFEKLELIAVSRCPHTGDLAIVINDPREGDEDDASEFDAEGSYDDNSGHCRFCGRQLTSEEQQDDRCEQCVKEEEKESKVCPHCHKELTQVEIDDDECYACGQHIPQETADDIGPDICPKCGKELTIREVSKCLDCGASFGQETP